jgi:hypothetical protein
MEIISGPWPWYIAGPLLGLMVPLLLLLDNKRFGISSNLRHICAACVPNSFEFFNYDWKKEMWNLFFLSGIMLGGWLTSVALQNPIAVQLDEECIMRLKNYGLNDFNDLLPEELFSLEALLSLKGFSFTFFGGFLVGFGTRYASGCTSGHSIFGLSTLQLPSLIATICFMLGGFISSNLLVPFLLRL